MHLFVLQKLSLHEETLATDRAVKRRRTTVVHMGFFVLIEIVLSREVLFAHRTREQFLPRV